MIQDNTRLFYVVDATETNEEIYTTLEEAERNYKELDVLPQDKPRLYIAQVKNAYFEKELNAWNYHDYSDTFEIIKIIK
jgi:hypothetical protein